MCGGWDGTSTLGDCWVWDGSDWRAAAAGPSPRWGHKSTYDWIRERVVVVGGTLDGVALFGDTWEWDGNTWWLRAASGPSPRCCHDLAFDLQRGRSLLTGSVAGDEWFYAGTALPAVSFYGAACPSSTRQVQLAASAPWLGDPLQLDATGGAAALALFALGFSASAFGAFALPLELSAFGMPGCTLLTSPDFVAVGLPQGGGARATLALPATASLAGVLVFSQALVADAQANAGGFLTTDGVRLRLGAR